MLAYLKACTWNNVSDCRCFFPWHPKIPYHDTSSALRHLRRNTHQELPWLLQARSPSWLQKKTKKKQRGKTGKSRITYEQEFSISGVIRLWLLPVEAPKARAFTTCPTVWMPPSAITGTPKRRAYSATLYTEVPWGLPHAITADKTQLKQSIIRIYTLRQVFFTSHTPSCVMQMDPHPMPTLRASTPASIRFFACAAVTTTESKKKVIWKTLLVSTYKI